MNFPTTTPGTLDRARTQIPRMAATGALVLALLGLSVPAASAGQSQQIVTKGGIVQFRDNGEILAATDTRADGYDVRAELYWAGGRAYVGDFGFDDAKERHVNLTIPEGTAVKLRMCYLDDARPVQCSHLQNGVA
jgi:hypothetical protein